MNEIGSFIIKCYLCLSFYTICLHLCYTQCTTYNNCLQTSWWFGRHHQVRIAANVQRLQVGQVVNWNRQADQLVVGQNELFQLDASATRNFYVIWCFKCNVLKLHIKYLCNIKSIGDVKHPFYKTLVLIWKL